MPPRWPAMHAHARAGALHARAGALMGPWRRGAGIVAGIVLVLASGCATLDREQCEQGEWRDLGYRDGLEGYEYGRVGRHREACSEFGIDVDRAAYKAGYEEGLSRYCTRTDPYQLGLDGGPYRGVCSRAFTREYRIGKRIHDYRERIEALEREIESLRADIDAAESDEERRGYRRRIDENHDEIDRLRRKIIATRLLREDADAVIDIIDLAD